MFCFPYLWPFLEGQLYLFQSHYYGWYPFNVFNSFEQERPDASESIELYFGFCFCTDSSWFQMVLEPIVIVLGVILILRHAHRPFFFSSHYSAWMVPFWCIRGFILLNQYVNLFIVHLNQLIFSFSFWLIFYFSFWFLTAIKYFWCY